MGRDVWFIAAFGVIAVLSILLQVQIAIPISILLVVGCLVAALSKRSKVLDCRVWLVCGLVAVPVGMAFTFMAMVPIGVGVSGSGCGRECMRTVESFALAGMLVFGFTALAAVVSTGEAWFVQVPALKMRTKLALTVINLLVALLAGGLFVFLFDI